MNEYFEDMKKLGVIPDVTTYNNLLNGCARNGDIEGMMNYYKTMLDAGVKPNMQTFHNLIHGYKMSDDTDSILKVYSDMKAYKYLYNSFAWLILKFQARFKHVSHDIRNLWKKRRPQKYARFL
jgi:pentatricopeptide repeat protein